MTREEIEQIIAANIRTNGRGEITAKVMAGVLSSFVDYTDSLSEKFVAMCNALADSFTVLVEEMEGTFEQKAEALELAFATKADELEGKFEDFCTALLDENFKPWAESLDANYRAVAAKYEETADGVEEALAIIREGNQSPVFIVPDGVKFGYSSFTAVPAEWDFSNVTNFNQMFQGCTALEALPSLPEEIQSTEYFAQGCSSLRSLSGLKDFPAGYLTFGSCMSLERVNSGEVVLVFPYMTFQYCTSLRSIVTTIPAARAAGQTLTFYGTFAGDALLDMVDISIEAGEYQYVFALEDTFQGCDALTQWPAVLDLSRARYLRRAFPPNLVEVPAFDASNLKEWNDFSGPCHAQIGAITNLGADSNENQDLQHIYLQAFDSLNLASLQNVVNGLNVAYFFGRQGVHLDASAFAIAQADTTVYTYEGNTYTGLIAYAQAKGWNITEG